jgi:hypothetical protein
MLANQLLLDHGPDLGIKVINQVLAIQDLRIGLEMEAFGRTIREFVIYSNLPYVSWVVVLGGGHITSPDFPSPVKFLMLQFPVLWRVFESIVGFMEVNLSFQEEVLLRRYQMPKSWRVLLQP